MYILVHTSLVLDCTVITTNNLSNVNYITISKLCVFSRSGALHVGDHILTIDGTSTEHCTVLEAIQLLASTSDVAKLEILPAHHMRLTCKAHENGEWVQPQALTDLVPPQNVFTKMKSKMQALNFCADFCILSLFSFELTITMAQSTSSPFPA